MNYDAHALRLPLIQAPRRRVSGRLRVPLQVVENYLRCYQRPVMQT